MYSFIVNPETNKKVSIASFVGKKILRNYINVLKGGSSREVDGFVLVEKDSVLSDLTFGDLEGEGAATKEAIPTESNIFDDALVIPKDDFIPMDIDCTNNINRLDKKVKARGTFKISHKPRCQKLWHERREAPFQSTPGCEQSSLMLYKSRGYEGDEKFKEEVQLQVDHNGPTIYKYGMCVGLKDTDYRAYKLEEKYDTSLLDLRAPIHLSDATTNIKSSLKSMLIDFAINFHGKGLAHYDIKLGNVLVKFASSDNTQIVKMKVIDYGLADSVISEWSLEGGIDSPPGTNGWKDPSARELGSLNYKTDIWAFGKLILLIYFGSYFDGPFDIQRRFTLEENLKNIYNNSPGKTNAEEEEENIDEWGERVFRIPAYSKMKESSHKNLRNLLFNMLHRNQHRRYNIIQVIESDFFSGVLPYENTFAGYSEAKNVISGLDEFIKKKVLSSGDGDGGAESS